MKRTVKFTDEQGNRALVTVEIQNERNGYLEFSACADYNGHLGQCRDSIQPKNEVQKKFLNLCEAWHLNGMNAGTEAQIKAIKGHEERTGQKLDYEKAVKYLKKIKKYTVKHPKTGEPYEYGHGWINRDLPADIEEQTNRLMDEVEAQEKSSRIKDRELSEAYEKHPQIVLNLFLGQFNDDASRALAVGLNDGLTVREALEITVDGNAVTSQGIDYLAGNDDEMEAEARESLENYVDECVISEIPDNLQGYFDKERFIDDAIRNDGRGHTLNHYDGGEDCQTVEGEEIYIYRQ